MSPDRKPAFSSGLQPDEFQNGNGLPAPTQSMETALSFIANPHTGRRDSAALSQCIRTFREESQALTTGQFAQAQAATLDRVHRLAESHQGQLPKGKLSYILQLGQILYLSQEQLLNGGNRR